jgi:hypothetical protein
MPFRLSEMAFRALAYRALGHELLKLLIDSSRHG